MLEGEEVLSPKGAVAAGPEEAARVGARILERGGNAMDAAAAACMACCMLQPHSTGVGGYVCAVVVLEGKSDWVWSLDANSIAPRKRPLNNVAPMILRMPDRDVAVGLPGGRRLISVSAQIARRVIEYSATSYEAAVAPRMHVQAKEPVEISESLGASILDRLVAMGHEVRSVRGVAGAAHGAEILKREGKVRAGGNTWAVGVS